MVLPAVLHGGVAQNESLGSFHAMELYVPVASKAWRPSPKEASSNWRSSCRVSEFVRSACEETCGCGANDFSIGTYQAAGKIRIIAAHFSSIHDR